MVQLVITTFGCVLKAKANDGKAYSLCDLSVVTSAKEVMFLSDFDCLFVCV